jgi:hypothetical protein
MRGVNLSFDWSVVNCNGCQRYDGCLGWGGVLGRSMNVGTRVCRRVSLQGRVFFGDRLCAEMRKRIKRIFENVL